MKLTATSIAVLLAAMAAAPAAQSAAVCPPPTPREACSARIVTLTIYNRSRVGQAELDAMLDVTNRIWTPYGVKMQPGRGPGAVAVVLSDRRSAPTNDGREVLGSTLFSEGHATPYIR